MQVIHSHRQNQNNKSFKREGTGGQEVTMHKVIHMHENLKKGLKGNYFM